MFSQEDMETTSQAYNGNSMYVSAPSSPSRFCSPSSNMVHFYSVRSSPTRMEAVFEEVNADFEDFEFETSKRFGQEGYSEFKKRPTLETYVPMAFADELFSNGQVVPLKPPPRLNYFSPNANSKNRCSSTAASSPNPVLKIPFPRWKNTWNDEFDPFAVALEKVKEEKRGKNHHHRRSRSLSPFRNTTTPPLLGFRAEGCLHPQQPPLQDQNKQGGPTLELMKHQIGPNCPQESDPQKSSQMVVSPREPQNKHKGLSFGKKVRPMKVGHEGTMKAVEEGKGKGFLGRENNEIKVMKEQVAALWKKLRSLSEAPKRRDRKKLSSKLKENAQKKIEKVVVEKPKMELHLGQGWVSFA